MRSLVYSLAAMAVLGAGTWAQAGSGGPRIDLDWINPFAYATYNVRFEAGRMADVRVKGYGNEVLYVSIYDSYGNLVAEGTDAYGEFRYTWRPRSGGTYRVLILNVHGTGQQYWISTN